MFRHTLLQTKVLAANRLVIVIQSAFVPTLMYTNDSLEEEAVCETSNGCALSHAYQAYSTFEAQFCREKTLGFFRTSSETKIRTL